MTSDDIESLVYHMDAEGFHYCFDGYSRWQEIDDEKFQELRKSYLNAAKELKEYVMYLASTYEDEDEYNEEFDEDE